MREIYILSGLGADERVFKSIDLSKYKVNFIKWVSPQPGELIEEYAKRLLSQINTSRPILVGLSFGGIMAVELSRLIALEKIIIISSAKTKMEIPFYFRWIGRFRIHKVIPASLLKKSNLFSNWFFGVESRDEKAMLKSILFDTDSTFLKWAIDQILGWKNTHVPVNLIHIHGAADKILPIHFVKCNFKIKGGGHLMILNKAPEISGLLSSNLN